MEIIAFCGIAVAEHTMALILASLKRLPAVGGYVTVERMSAAGSPYRPYDRRHAGGNNYARVSGLRNLFGLTLGLLGMGEIGREVAARARAFGMHLIGHARDGRRKGASGHEAGKPARQHLARGNRGAGGVDGYAQIRRHRRGA